MTAYHRLELTPGERKSFAKEPEVGFVSHFPLTLYRAVGRHYGSDELRNKRATGDLWHSLKTGRYWFDAELFWSLRRAVAARGTPAEDREVLLRWLLRDQLAVCRDWSSIDSIYCLHLTHEPLYAAWGQAKPQPLDSKPGARFAGDPAALLGTLAGGGLQYVIDIEAQGLEGKVKRYLSVRALAGGGEA
jgi:hypothetical protein